MKTDTPKYLLASLLGCCLAIAATSSAGQAPPPQSGQAADPQHPAETQEEKEKKEKEKKKQQQKERERQQQQHPQPQPQQDKQKPPPPPTKPKQPERQQPPQDKPPRAEQPKQQSQQPQQTQQERQREIERQKQQDRELQQKRAQQERQLKQRRVSQQEQQERIRKQEQQLALYRKNIALREELAERDAKILRQQNRIQHLRFQQQYEQRLRAQRASLMQARYDYNNDPFYYTAPNYRYVRDGRYYQTNQYGIRKLEQALQAGYDEGYRAGRADREDRWRYDYRSAFAYKDANFGYDGRYIAQDEYNHYFREGFQRGYDDGYYNRNKYGRKKDDGGINDEWLIAGAVVAAIIGYQVLTD
jgi:hypothetical protein